MGIALAKRCVISGCLHWKSHSRARWHCLSWCGGRENYIQGTQQSLLSATKSRFGPFLVSETKRKYNNRLSWIIGKGRIKLSRFWRRLFTFAFDRSERVPNKRAENSCPSRKSAQIAYAMIHPANEFKKYEFEKAILGTSRALDEKLDSPGGQEIADDVFFHG